jgi:hypothetical protein
MSRSLIFGIVLCLSAAAAAERHHRIRIEPAVFDPHDTDRVASLWIPLPERGGFDPALLLVKEVNTNVEAAAGAEVEGVEGITLRELGFDVLDFGHCGAGAPRFNVITSDGSLYFFGCSHGLKSKPDDDPELFTRVRFRDEDAFPQFLTDPPWPGFGHAVVKQIQIVFDEGIDEGPGFVVLDNFDFNGQFVRGPRR